MFWTCSVLKPLQAPGVQCGHLVSQGRLVTVQTALCGESNSSAQDLVPGGFSLGEYRLVWHMLPEPQTCSQESKEVISCELMT